MSQNGSDQAPHTSVDDGSRTASNGDQATCDALQSLVHSTPEAAPAIDVLAGLNPAQQEAVQTLSGPLLMLAGAGSGKTKTLTHRIANLILHGVAPGRILAVTFTNKAAKEMRQRLWRLLQTPVAGAPSQAPGVPGAAPSPALAGDLVQSGEVTPTDLEPPRNFMPYMGTFHGICVRILRIEAEAAGISRDFTIYDSDDQTSLVKRVMKEQGITDKKLKPAMILSSISNSKMQGLGPEQFLQGASSPQWRQTAAIYAGYEQEKEKAGALDFDDLLLYALRLFENHAEVREKWRQRFEHILIDEYQDTNAVQYRLVKILVGPEQNICAVGDDWQSIYSWRGADFTNILNFTKDFPQAKVIKLEQNYRSTGRILAASQQIIKNNKTRTDKTLFTEAGDGEPIEIHACRDEKDEARWVVGKIYALNEASRRADYPGPERSYSDFAILYRTNAQSFAFEEALMNASIPYKIVGGVRFYDRKEVKDVLAILKLLVNQRDAISLLRVVRNVLPGIGETSAEKILAAIEVLPGDQPLFDPDLPQVLRGGKARESLRLLVTFLRKHTPRNNFAADTAGEEAITPASAGVDEANHGTPTQNIVNVAGRAAPAQGLDRDQDGILEPGEIDEHPAETIEAAVHYFRFEELLDTNDPGDATRLDNLSVLASNAIGYRRIADFLADAALLSSADEATAQNSVTLMTLHAAKGLEFPVVFMVGMEAGLFPSPRSVDEGNLEEERRLAYVGITRAMELLFMTYAHSRYNFGRRETNLLPSQFLLELGYNPYGEPTLDGPTEGGSFSGTQSGSWGDDFGESPRQPWGDKKHPLRSQNWQSDGFNDDFDRELDAADFERDDWDPFPEDVPKFGW